MKKIFFASLISVSAFISAQNTRNVGDFSKLKAYDRLNVELIPAADAKVEIIGYEDDDVETINKNGELKIRMSVAKLMQGTDTKVKVYYTSLNDVQASQGAVITSPSTLESSMLNLTSNEGSKINLKIDTSNLTAKLNSGAEINLTGKAISQDLTVNSGAKFSGKNLDSENAKITVNAGGVAEVFADSAVSTTTRAGGRIEVYGNPNDRNVKKIAGGKVNFH